MARTTSPAPARHEPRGTKVPAITPLFWFTKVLTTGMGETTSDYFAHRFSPIPVGMAGFVCFALVLWAQLATRRYMTWVYWSAVVMVSVFGTMAADGLHVELGMPYVMSTTLYVVGLTAVFATWHAAEGTLDVHRIDTPARERFYWAAVLATFALGTAAGDMTAITLHLGYLSSGLMFLGLMAIPAIAYWRGWMNPILAFWFAYVLTRPLGASFADWIGVTGKRGGLGFGTAQISLVLLAAIAILVAILARTEGAAVAPDPAPA